MNWCTTPVSSISSPGRHVSHKSPQKDDVLRARHAASSHFAGWLLDADSLVVLIDCLFHVNGKGTRGLALRTGARFHLTVLVLDERSQQEAALVAVVFDDPQLRHD